MLLFVSLRCFLGVPTKMWATRTVRWKKGKKEASSFENGVHVQCGDNSTTNNHSNNDNTIMLLPVQLCLYLECCLPVFWICNISSFLLLRQHIKSNDFLHCKSEIASNPKNMYADWAAPQILQDKNVHDDFYWALKWHGWAWSQCGSPMKNNDNIFRRLRT